MLCSREAELASPFPESGESAGYNALGSWSCLPPTQSALLNQSQPVLELLLEPYLTSSGKLWPSVLLGTLVGLSK